MLALRFKQCKSDTDINYFIDEETRKLDITIIYVNDKAKIYNEIEILWSWKNQRVSWNIYKS